MTPGKLLGLGPGFILGGLLGGIRRLLDLLLLRVIRARLVHPDDVEHRVQLYLVALRFLLRAIHPAKETDSRYPGMSLGGLCLTLRLELGIELVASGLDRVCERAVGIRKFGIGVRHLEHHLLAGSALNHYTIISVRH